MNATLASPPWPAAWPAAPWRFGQAGRAGTVHWEIKRNCSITPGQLGVVYLSLCALLLLIAAGFAWFGAPVVLAFAGVELVVLGLALLIYARHARDGDSLVLAGASLAVEQSHGARVQRTEFRTAWVSIEPSTGEGSLVEISGDGRRVCIGRFLRPELRPALARELRQALRGARGVGDMSSAAAGPAGAD